MSGYTSEYWHELMSDIKRLEAQNAELKKLNQAAEHEIDHKRECIQELTPAFALRWFFY